MRWRLRRGSTSISTRPPTWSRAAARRAWRCGSCCSHACRNESAASLDSDAMKAIAVHPGRPNSMHLREIPEPNVTDIADGRGVLVRVLRVGVDGTDKEIN